MPKEKFLEDVQKVYDYISRKKDDLNKLYYYLENKQYDKLEIIEQFADNLQLKLNDGLYLALINRLVSLRDDSLIQVLQQSAKSEDEITKIIEQAYQFVSVYWSKYHQDTIEYIESNRLLTPFYEAVFKGVYNVGIKMSIWQSSWTNHIINNINKELLNRFGSDEKVIEYLNEHNLFDMDDDKQLADRSYSVLIKQNDHYTVKAYKEGFKQEVEQVIDALEDFSDNLIELDDDIYNQKWQYVKYIQSLITALSEKRTNRLIHYWAEVDRNWMQITTPIQIGHPLEYYEDHYRRAVALEWDIRLSNPTYQKQNQRANKIDTMAKIIYNKLNSSQSYDEIYKFAKKSLNKVQLYLGRPALFFAAEFNGLFSAQVVPNDENVSKEYGKKIFAFSDEILQTQRAKPFLQLSKEILGERFLKEDRKFLFTQDEAWHKVYDITTIGHEFGHILWCDDTTQIMMNKSGNFKNIEEFKATSGGLVSFFLDNSDEQYLEQYVINDTIKRAIGLIAWMEVDEVQPYYCEGLIHLAGLFETSILVWDNNNFQLQINKLDENIEKLKQWYIDIYSSLALHYLQKKDATLWLNKFAIKDKNFLPVDENIKKFVLYYYKRYKEIGQVIDYSDDKQNYIQG